MAQDTLNRTNIKQLVTVQPLRERDLTAADRVFRTAFGTFIGLPDPSAFGGDSDYINTRWRANPNGAFAAYLDQQVVGSNFASQWGSVGFFGPLTVRPDLWDRGVARQLMEPVVACFARWGVTHAGLFTFANSSKHVSLYQRFGFWPRFLTAIMSRPIDGTNRHGSDLTQLSNVSAAERESLIAACRDLTDQIYDGLDVTSEMRSVAEQDLGDTVLVCRDGTVKALAVCHVGAGSEAGSGTCYIKFGAARPGSTASADFDALLVACEAFAAAAGARRVSAGVNTARHEAYAQMRARGYRTDVQGVAMHRPNEEGYNRPGVYLLDDWR
jgi:GNAT superfamily N-acetyltransferase